MGFSTVGAGIIVFLGFLVASTMVTNAYFSAEREVRDASYDDKARSAFDRETDLRFDQWDFQGNRLHLYYTNIGGTTLDLDDAHLVIDGAWSNDLIEIRDVDGDTTTSFWPPGTQLHYRVNIQPQPSRAWFVTESGRGLIATP